MTAHRSRCTWVGLVMTAISAGPAVAGPITWSYRAEASIPAAHADNFRLIWLTQTGEYPTTLTNYDNAVGFQLFRSKAVVEPPQSPDQNTVEYSFDVMFRIIDRVSGESAVLPFSGWYETWWRFDPHRIAGLRRIALGSWSTRRPGSATSTIPRGSNSGITSTRSVPTAAGRGNSRTGRLKSQWPPRTRRTRRRSREPSPSQGWVWPRSGRPGFAAGAPAPPPAPPSSGGKSVLPRIRLTRILPRRPNKYGVEDDEDDCETGAGCGSCAGVRRPGGRGADSVELRAETGVGLTGFYSAHVTMGHEFKNVYDPVTDTETLIEYNIIANIGSAVVGSRTGSDRVRALGVGPLELTRYDLTDEWATTRGEFFDARIIITDGASGASRDLMWWAKGRSIGFFETGSFVVNLTVEDRTDTFVLGENRYTVRADVMRWSRPTTSSSTSRCPPRSPRPSRGRSPSPGWGWPRSGRPGPASGPPAVGRIRSALPGPRGAIRLPPRPYQPGGTKANA